MPSTPPKFCSQLSVPKEAEEDDIIAYNGEFSALFTIKGITSIIEHNSNIIRAYRHQKTTVCSSKAQRT